MNEMCFITVHPSVIEAYSPFGVFGAAQKRAITSIRAIDLRQFGVDKRGSIDDRPYGGGDGMIMRPEPLRDAVQSCPAESVVIYTSPAGREFNHRHAVELSKERRPLVFVCGRFGGVDQRFLDRWVHLHFSLGSYVISGGELPCLTIADAVLRQIPGVLGNEQSKVYDSYAAGLDGLIEGPQYTRPEVFEGAKVPEVLMSGDHEAIAKWRAKQCRKPRE